MPNSPLDPIIQQIYYTNSLHMRKSPTNPKLIIFIREDYWEGVSAHLELYGRSVVDSVCRELMVGNTIYGYPVMRFKADDQANKHEPFYVHNPEIL